MPHRVLNADNLRVRFVGLLRVQGMHFIRMPCKIQLHIKLNNFGKVELLNFYVSNMCRNALSKIQEGI